jgi:enoyl-CoA hydratase
MSYTTIQLEERANYSIISLHRPDKLNALNATLLQELHQAIMICQDSKECKAIIITGTGTKAFAAGADITQLHQQNKESGYIFAREGQDVFTAIEQCNKPVIAAVNGFALGGGCELAMACHIRFASSTAKFGQPEVNLGIIPGYGGTQRLTLLVGPAKSAELILTGAIISAEQAFSIGLVNSVHSPEELMSYAIDCAEIIASKAPLAITASLKSIRACIELNASEGMEFEAKSFADTCGTSDFKEGTLAFLEKRVANFTGN